MYMIVLGTLLLVLKVAQFGPPADWSWFVVLAPFGLAVIWWAWADSSGWTKRRAMDKMDEKRRKRRSANLDALGLDDRGARTDAAKRGFRDVQSAKIEDKRAQIRNKNRRTLARSTKPGNLDPADSRY